MATQDLNKAKKAKNDEFYTRYEDIEVEVNAYLEYNKDVFRNKTILLPCDDPEWSNFTKYFAQNFTRLGLRKLISTSYAPNSNKSKTGYQPTLFEVNDPQYDEYKTKANGKIFVLDKDNTGDGKIDVDDLEWHYLQGDGDFQSDEVIKLRDEADVIITNPPFSLFRDFLFWITEANKEFLIIGNMNSISCKEIFPLIQDNKIWLGNGFNKGNAFFRIPSENKTDYADGVFDEKTGLVKFRNVGWFTNIEHGRRHQPLSLMTMADNLKYSKHKIIKDEGYIRYDEYDAIEVPFSDAIPNDFLGLMGVPITFLDKYCPEQFQIIGLDRYVKDNPHFGKRFTINGKEKYARIIIRKIN